MVPVRRADVGRVHLPRVEHPGQVLAMPTPMPTWEGVDYVGQAALPTFRTGDGTGPSYSFGR